MTSYQTQRDFLESCYQAGWRFSRRSDGHYPGVAGTFEWDCALSEAQGWLNYQQLAKEEL